MRRFLHNPWLLGCLIVGGSVFALWMKAEPAKKPCCANISVQCDCVPQLCRCGGTKTCTESCYQEAVRKGLVK